MMTVNAVKRRVALRVAFHAETHVDFLDRNHAVHRLHRAMALLAGKAGMDMGAMGELDEVRQRVNAVPLNLERRLFPVGPCARDRLDTARRAAPVTPHASRNRRDPRGLRTARVFVAILARDLVDAGVDPMTERDGLDHVGARQPGALRNSDGGDSAKQEDGRKRQKYPVHLGI